MTKLKPVIMLLLCAMPLTGMAQSDDDDLKALYNTLDSLIELQPTIVAEKQKRRGTLQHSAAALQRVPCFQVRLGPPLCYAQHRTGQ